jgi:hypothetical protein
MTRSCPRLVARARGVAHGSSSARFVAAPRASNSSTMSGRQVVAGSPREWGRTMVVILRGDRRAGVEQDRRGGVKPGRGRFCAPILIASRFPSQIQMLYATDVDHREWK